MADRIPETELQRALAEVSAQRLARYKEKYVPIQKRAIEDIKDTTDETRQARALTNIDRAVAFKDAGKGVPPSVAGLANLGRAQEESVALGMGQVPSLVETNKQQNMLAMARMGQGQASDSFRTLGNLAQNSAQQARIDAEAAVAAENALRQATGTAAGLAYGAYNPTKTFSDSGLTAAGQPATMSAEGIGGGV